MGNKVPKKQMYPTMNDTPWISQARDIASRGGQGILNNYNNVNTFNEDTNKSLDARTNAVYNRAYDDFNKAYNKTMGQYAGANYNQFGSTSNTPASYRTDMENLKQQRALADLGYNQALNYDALKDAELQRRYNTLDMFGNMYQYGRTPYDLDLMNYKTGLENLDRQYDNDVTKASSGGGFGGALKGALSGAASGAAFGPWGMAIGALGGAGLGSMPQYNSGGQGAFSMGDIANLGSAIGGGISSFGKSGTDFNLSNLFKNNSILSGGGGYTSSGLGGYA